MAHMLINQKSGHPSTCFPTHGLGHADALTWQGSGVLKSKPRATAVPGSKQSRDRFKIPVQYLLMLIGQQAADRHQQL